MNWIVRRTGAVLARGSQVATWRAQPSEGKNWDLRVAAGRGGARPEMRNCRRGLPSPQRIIWLRPLVCTKNSNPDVMMVKPVEDGERFNASRPLDRAEDRRILVKGSLSSDAVVIVRIESQDSAQMRLA